MPLAAVKDETCDRFCLAREVLDVQLRVRDRLDIRVPAMRAKLNWRSQTCRNPISALIVVANGNYYYAS